MPTAIVLGKKVHISDFPIINVTVDLALFRVNPYDHHKVDVLLIERGGEPFKGCWALPGGFLNYDERPLDAAIRECAEETAVVTQNLKFVTMLDEPGRDPRGRVLSYLYAGWITGKAVPRAGDDAAAAMWASLSSARNMDLAFDHFNALSLAQKALEIRA